jgi:hypothetical protein
VDTIELATIVAAGTVLVAAPIDPRPLRDICRRHPDASPSLAECPGCVQELHETEKANRACAEAERVAKVNQALGFSDRSMPQPFLGETATSLTMWSQHELNTVYERVGGTITTRIVERTGSTGSTWQATEITLTVEVDGIGPVTVSTDWDEESGGHDLPLMRALAAPAPEILETVPANGCLLGYDRFVVAPGAPLPDGRTIATVEDPLGSAWRVTDDRGAVHYLHKYGNLIRYTSGVVAFIEPEWAGWSSD